jgi:hypothetical protein
MLSSTLPTVWAIGGDYVSLTKEGDPFFYRVFLSLIVIIRLISLEQLNEFIVFIISNL